MTGNSYIEIEHGQVPVFVTLPVLVDQYEFRLVFSEKWGFGLQAREFWAGEDWVDVELMQDAGEVTQVFTHLLNFSLEYSTITLKPIGFGIMHCQENGNLYMIKHFGMFGELEFYTFGNEEF